MAAGGREPIDGRSRLSDKRVPQVSVDEAMHHTEAMRAAARQARASADEHEKAIEAAREAEAKAASAAHELAGRSNTRRQFTIEEKLNALALLGHVGGGTFVAAKTNELGNVWTQRGVARSLGVNSGVITKWVKNAATLGERVASGSLKAKLSTRVREGMFDDVGASLSAYVRSIKSAAGHHFRFFNGPLLREKAKSIAKGIIDAVEKELKLLYDDENGELPVAVEKLQRKLVLLKTFKASDRWISVWKEKFWFRSAKGSGKNGLVPVADLGSHRKELANKLAETPLRNILNSDEIGLLFCSGPSRSYQPTETPARHEVMKERISALLTVSAAG